MAEYTENEICRAVSSEDGSQLYFMPKLAEHSQFQLMRALSFTREPLKILDINGAADGMNSAVKVQFTRLPDEVVLETIRIKETPIHLKEVFECAGLEIPPVTRSMGGIMRDIRDAMKFGPR